MKEGPTPITKNWSVITKTTCACWRCKRERQIHSKAFKNILTFRRSRMVTISGQYCEQGQTWIWQGGLYIRVNLQGNPTDFKLSQFFRGTTPDFSTLNKCDQIRPCLDLNNMLQYIIQLKRYQVIAQRLARRVLGQATRV